MRCPTCGSPGNFIPSWKAPGGLEPYLCKFICDNPFPHIFYAVSKSYALKKLYNQNLAKKGQQTLVSH